MIFSTKFLKANVNVLVLLSLSVYGNGAAKHHRLYRDKKFDPNDVTVCTTPVVDKKKMLILAIEEVESQLVKSFKVSILKLRRQTHTHKF